MQLPSWLQSSADPAQISLSIESAGKALVGLVALFAVAKGMDASAAQNAFQMFVDQAATLATSAYTVYHTAQTLYGLLRKFVMWLATRSTPAGQ